MCKNGLILRFKLKICLRTKEKKELLLIMKNTNKNVLKNMNGITLIALVVSIIIMLILAGISIGMLIRK